MTILTMTMLTLMVKLLQASTPYAPPGSDATRLYSTDSLVTSLLIVGSLLLTLLLSTMAFLGNVLKQRSAQNVLRWRRDGSPVQVPPSLAECTSLCCLAHCPLPLPHFVAPPLSCRRGRCSRVGLTASSLTIG